MNRTIIVSACLGLAAGAPARADESDTDTKAELTALRAQVESLTRLVKDLQQQVSAKTPGDTPSAPAMADLPPAPPPDFPPEVIKAPEQTNLSIFNPEISMALDAVGSYSSAYDNTNLILRDAEIMVQANVDQVAHAYAVFNAETELAPDGKSDPFSDVSLGVEEAAIETTALPGGLGLKAGQFFADFTRLGKVHSHELPFTDRPASLDRIIGGETKSRGVEVNWMPPVDHYCRLTAGAVDHIGAEPAVTESLATLGDGEGTLAYDRPDHRSFSDPFYYARAATIFELGDSTTLNIGADYGGGRDAGSRRLASADFKLTWLPNPSRYDQLTAGGEVLWGRSGGALAADSIYPGSPHSGSATAKGGYVYAQYRIGKTWEPGIRFDWLHPRSWEEMDANGDGTADGLGIVGDSLTNSSAYLTYHISEFNRLRFGLSYASGDRGSFNGSDHDLLAYIQWSITLGPHKHSFQP